jgi:hypothetical protein
MDEWARAWLTEQRKQGKKGLEVKEISNNYYVYHSTSYWDKQLKKRRKISIGHRLRYLYPILKNYA